jgi:ubiquinone/menaquinone biosynthesis C-methylase UbiE
MRILDVGCGVGDVSLLAGRLVGSAGSVLGIDPSADAVKTAKRRAIAAGLHHVTFAACELDAFGTEHLFDAVIGRLVLMYMPHPAATLRLLGCHLRPGGIVAFQEMVMQGCRSIPEGPLFRRCLEWIMGTFERGGFETDTGGKLFSTFLAAKLPAPKMVSVSHIDGGAKSPVYEYIAETLRSLLPMMERLGVATDADVLVETLAHRLREEAIALRTCVTLPPLVGAWVRTQV